MILLVLPLAYQLELFISGLFVLHLLPSQKHDHRTSAEHVYIINLEQSEPCRH